MFLIIGLWIYMFWLFLAFGIAGKYLIGFLVKDDSDKEFRPANIDLVVMGFLLVSILLSYISIILPLNKTIETSLIVVGLIISGFFWRDLKSSLSLCLKFIREIDKVLLLLLTFSIIIILFLSVGKIYNYDTGLYHSQAIIWNQEYAVVPGLGNLHERFAFNSHFFIPSAIFSYENPKAFLIYHLNNFFFVVFLFFLVQKLNQAIKSFDWFGVLLNTIIVFLSFCYFTLQLTSPSPDMICAILICMVGLYFLERHKIDQDIFNKILFTFAILVCATFKLSSLLYVLFLPFIWRLTSLNTYKLLAVLGFIVFIPFFYRNYIISGYLIYPLDGIDMFNPEWKLAEASPKNMRDIVKSWAMWPSRNRDEVLALPVAVWAKAWFDRQPLLMTQVLITNLFCIVPMVIALIRKQYYVLILMVINLINIAFWFFNAPDTRFAYGFLFLGASITIAYSIGSLLNVLEVLNKKLIIKTLAYAMLIFCIVRPLYVTGAEILIRKPPLHSLQKPRVRPPSNVKLTENASFTTYTPKKGDQCFNSKLPCTPYPRKNLVKRKPKTRSFQDGFKVD